MNFLAIASIGVLLAVSGCATVPNPVEPKPLLLSSLADNDAAIASATAAKPSLKRKNLMSADSPQRSDSQGDFAKSEFIVKDFLSVLLRIPSIAPSETPISTALPRTRFGEILMDSIRDAGYTMVLGPAANVPILSYRIELPSSLSTNSHTFFVSVGDVHLKRSYELVGEQIAPTSEMLMAGVRPEQVLPVAATLTPAAAAAELPSLPAEAESADNLAELKAPDLNRLLRERDDWDPLVPNMYETGKSVYSSVFTDSTAQYDEVQSEVLVFDNDSLVLGVDNKEFLYGLADEFDIASDLIQVIGCSHGNTALEGGNQLLARGRAARVREELLLAGLSEDSVLHEACWANVHFDELMPRRGVVVKHLRERI